MDPVICESNIREENRMPEKPGHSSDTRINTGKNPELPGILL